MIYIYNYIFFLMEKYMKIHYHLIEIYISLLYIIICMYTFIKNININ